MQVKTSLYRHAKGSESWQGLVSLLDSCLGTIVWIDDSLTEDGYLERGIEKDAK
jgi:hypothetical protein